MFNGPGVKQAGRGTVKQLDWTRAADWMVAPSMNARRVFAHALFLFAAALLAAEPENLGLLKQRVRAWFESPEYFEAIEPVAREAAAFIVECAAQRTGGERLAVVLDIDETALSNYPHIRAVDFSYEEPRWNAWLLESRCPPVEPVIEVHRAARDNGVAVFFISGRRELSREATARNLEAAGFGGFEGLVLKPDDSDESTGAFKARERARIAGAGWTIIACVGDQRSDLEGGNTGRTFKVPNPAYFID